MIDCDVDLEGVDPDTVLDWIDERDQWEPAGRISTMPRMWCVQYEGERDTVIPMTNKLGIEPDHPLDVVHGVAKYEEADINDVAQDLRDYADKEAT